MALQSAFKIVSQFKFEVGHAVAGTQKLGSSLDKLSGKLKDIEAQFKLLGAGTALQVTGAAGGIVGLLRNATEASDKFKASQLALAQILESNASKLKGFQRGTGLETAKSVMQDVARSSRRAGLDPDDYLEIFKALNANLLGKGVAGVNFGQMHRLTKSFMLSAPILGVTPGQAQGQLMSAVEGKRGFVRNDQTLFRRLTGETETMKGYANQAGRFNVLTQKKRLDLVVKAMEELSNNSRILAERKNTLNYQFRNFISLFRSFDSVLRPLGDVINRILIKGLKILNNYVGKTLRDTIKRIAVLVDYLTKDMVDFYVAFERVKSLGGSVKFAHKFSLIAYIAIEFRKIILKAWSVVWWLFKKLFLAAGFVLAKTGILKKVPTILGFLISSVANYIKWAGALFVLSRIFESVKAKMKGTTLEYIIQELKNLPKLFSGFVTSLGNIIGPFQQFIDRMAGYFIQFVNALSPEGHFLKTLKKAAERIPSLTEKIGVTLSAFFAVIETALVSIGALLEPIMKLKNLNPVNLFKSFGEALKNLSNPSLSPGTVFDSILKQYFSKMKDFADREKEKLAHGKQPIINQNNKIEIRNQFPENMEPDRIAQTIHDIFLKAATNPTSTMLRNNTLNPT